MAVLWLTLLPHSNKVLGLNPPSVEFSRLIGDSKLAVSLFL